MSRLGLKTVFMGVPAWNQATKQTYAMTPKYITIHNTANNASARGEISYMIGNTQWTSYHWAVDDIEAIQAIPHNRNAWHCGDGQGAGNMSSIGIEICHSLTPGNPRYAKSEDNGAKLTAIILYDLGWGIDRIRKHQDWSGKYCPHRILDNGNWEGFKRKVQEYLNQLRGAKPAPAPKPTSVPSVRHERGSYTFKSKSAVKNTPDMKAKGVAVYSPGEVVHYDQVVVANGYEWLSYISHSGVRRYVARKRV